MGRPTHHHQDKAVIQENIHISPAQRALDLGCGPGIHRHCFTGTYCGIDINPRYIEAARQRHQGEFLVMDCTALELSAGTFDHVVSIATTHHLSDPELVQTIQEAGRVCKADGIIHILDAVLPLKPGQLFKEAYFRLDRGRYPRRLDALVNVMMKAGKVALVKTKTGPLHDLCYVRMEAHG
jgi:ubiquinone/menaquinone biosynthesis C-methylase UbiE